MIGPRHHLRDVGGRASDSRVACVTPATGTVDRDVDPGARERAGVRAQLLARGEYKSMREMFTAARMSEENREMLTSLVSDLNQQLVERCASARQLTPEAARAAIDRGPFRAEEALACGLIDSTQYVDQLADEVGVEEGKVLSASAYRRGLRRVFGVLDRLGEGRHLTRLVQGQLALRSLRAMDGRPSGDIGCT